MDYSKVKTIDSYDLSKIRGLPDENERIGLIKSWLGQRNWCIAKAIPRSERRIATHRRVKRDQHELIKHYNELAVAWEDKIARCLAGEPLEDIKGKIKIPKGKEVANNGE